MGRVYLFNDFEENTINIISLICKVEGAKQSFKEKSFGLDFLGILNNGDNIHHLTYEDTLIKYNLNESFLINFIEENLINFNEVAYFYLDYDNYVYVELKKVLNQNSRRYIIVEFRGSMYLTSVNGLSQGTSYYKPNRIKGLEWDDYLYYA